MWPMPSNAFSIITASSLPQIIRAGSPFSDFTPLSCTFMLENHNSAPLHPAAINAYIQEELDAGSLFGPCPRVVVERLLSSCFSLISPGHGVSVNDQINSNDFLTRWGTAGMIVEVVSPSFRFQFRLYVRPIS
ncbi:uncharacterized protein LAESUDRAFT_212359 [Laetiporus sulphureus 93-53]|uniref:Uncharacterized protein n=1 Tax=Laetiporus sulphureus 93-53 TaxID=1314785 RepID=A0A165DVN9_9APHY|nr:uncharacterized protein LAESUDRAFT_212359 [Laetiporus sulphureus 93-53]KZT05722.1 hypothetical protein LAESUDRAFT_212359 [Laetiporus sulphureus 93-53]